MKKKNKEQFETWFNKAKDFFSKKNFIISNKNLRSILASINNHYPVLLTGPTGSGKTLFLMLLAEFVGGEYNYQSLNGSVTIHELTQERILGDKGEFKTNDMILTTWLRQAQKGISFLHLDEVNAARPETLLALHPIMDIKGELNLTYTKESLKVNDNAVLVLSMNEGDEYTGVNAMNMAFQNRFVKIHIPYIQGEQLMTMLSLKTGITYENAAKVVNTWEKYMQSKEYDQPVISIRVLERWCELSHTIGLRAAALTTFASLVATNEEEMVEIEEGDLFVNLPE